MQSPPTSQYRAAVAPQAPRGRFDWAVLSEATDILRISPLNFFLLALIGWIGAYTAQQVGAAPNFFLAISGQTGSTFLVGTAIFTAIGYIIFFAILGGFRAGSMRMTQIAVGNQIPDISEGFRSLNRFFTYAVCGLAPWIVAIPIIAIVSGITGNQFLEITSVQDPSLDAMWGMFAGIGGGYILVFVVLIVTFPFFILALPAAFLKNLSIQEAISEGFRLGRANYSSLILFTMLSGVLHLVIFSCCCCIPMPILTPYIAAATLLIYRDVSMTPIVQSATAHSGSIYPREYGAQMSEYGRPTQESGDIPPPPAPPGNPES